MDRNDFRRRAGILNELDSGSYQITPQDVTPRSWQSVS